MHLINYKKNAGVGMIEVLITLLIISIGLLGLVALQTQSVRAATDSSQRTAAIDMVTEVLERMHINRAQAVIYQAAVANNCAAPPAVQCGSGRVANNIVVGVACTAQQMAVYDVWEAMCDHGNVDANGRGKSTAFDNVVQPQLLMACNPAPCAVNSTVTMTLTIPGRPNARKAVPDNHRVVMTAVL